MSRFNLPKLNDNDVGTNYLIHFFSPEHKNERAEEHVRVIISLASVFILLLHIIL